MRSVKFEQHICLEKPAEGAQSLRTVKRIRSVSARVAIATTRRPAGRSQRAPRFGRGGHRQHLRPAASQCRRPARADFARFQHAAACSPAPVSTRAVGSNSCRSSGRRAFHSSKPFLQLPWLTNPWHAAGLRTVLGKRHSRRAPECRQGPSGCFVLRGSWRSPRDSPASRGTSFNSRLANILRQAGVFRRQERRGQ